MKKSVKDFLGKFVKNSEKLDEIEEEIDDRLEYHENQTDSLIKFKLILFVLAMLVLLYYYFLEKI